MRESSWIIAIEASTAADIFLLLPTIQKGMNGVEVGEEEHFQLVFLLFYIPLFISREQKEEDEQKEDHLPLGRSEVEAGILSLSQA